ncbi:MAG: HAMP domain-containing histidine kinase [Lachnospiraceae bacterium]|nr:HAMP domain-containing histidine kinase [Lachnospiraceae bacterium]
MFFINLVVALLVLFTWFAAREYTLCGDKNLRDRNRAFSMEKLEKKDFESREALVNVLSTAKYTVTDTQTGEVLLTEHYYKLAFILLACALSIFVLEILLSIISFPFETARTKRILRPINEMAIRADELARLDFSGDKYHLIEEKINTLAPDETVKLSYGDADLLGIEQALNNLLERVRESNKQQARFVDDVSHELRTPIAVIEGYANMLSRWGKEDEKVLDESIAAIQHESANMKHLVEQLLFLARGDAGRTVVNKERISVIQVVKEVYEESLMIDEDHIYRLNVPDEDIFVLGDEGLLKQAVRILVDNASKYTNKREEITLSAGHGQEGEAYLMVQDTGIGMNQEDIEHMFDRFYRASEARSFDGTGLGLSIAKWIVDRHGGYFKITSREDLGTRIGIYLPSV